LPALLFVLGLYSICCGFRKRRDFMPLNNIKRCFSSRLYSFVAVFDALASEEQGAGAGCVGYGS
jgi:hypothetical protein